MEHPEQFLKIKMSPRFPKSSDKQVDFLARAIGAAMAGYKPSTGARYLAKVDLCEQCGERKADIELEREGKIYLWCGVC